jgi:hypothetical protein
MLGELCVGLHHPLQHLLRNTWILYCVSNEDQGIYVPRHHLYRHTSIFCVYKWQNS